MNKISALLLLAGWNLGFAVSAQTNAPATRSLTLQDCIVEALQHNFDIQVQRFYPLEAQLGLQSDYAGYDPTLSISGGHTFTESGATFNNGIQVPSDTTDANGINSSLSGVLPTGTGLGYTFSGGATDSYGTSGGEPFKDTSGSFGVSVNQPLLQGLWIDKTRLSVSLDKIALKTSVQALRQKLIDTISSVENAYYELIYARENLRVQEEALNLAQTQLNQDKERVEVGSLAPLDVQQDEAQTAQDHASVIAAQLTLTTDQNALKTLITDDYLKWHDVDISPSDLLASIHPFVDLQDSWSKGMLSRPDLLQAKLAIEHQGIQLKYDRNQLFPQLDLTASYGYNGAGNQFSDALGQMNEGSRPYFSYGGSLSIPLGNIAPRNAYKNHQAVEQQDLLQLKQLEQNAMVAIDNAVKQVESTWESVGATREQRIYAEAALDAEQKKYAVGKSTTFTVLQLQNNVTSARSQEIRAQANYQEALTNLAQQEGSTLERRKVDVAGK